MALKKRVYALFSSIQADGQWQDEVIDVYSQYEDAMHDCNCMRKRARNHLIHYWVEGFDLRKSKQEG